MPHDETAHNRPYWHVDLKWIFGILTFVFLHISLLLYTATILTSEKIAIPLATYIVASQFSKNGLDDTTGVEAEKKKFLTTEEEFYYPFEGRSMRLSREDMQKLSPREIRLKIFQQTVEPFYHGKPDEEALKEAGLLALINEQTHNQIQLFFYVSLIPFVLTQLGLIGFSYHYGKLISPAVVFLLVSVVPSILAFLIVKRPPQFMPEEMIQSLTASLSMPYNILFLTGTALLLLATLLRLFKKKEDYKLSRPRTS